jgi:NAD(P)-dependent dehydrogenase (short-subunit alcohol dehydrogenase family)
VNITAMFHICKAAVKHMPPGSAIINTTSVNSDNPKPTLLAYATTKGRSPTSQAGLAQLLAEKGIRVNSVAPGPIWTPLIPVDHAARPGGEFRAAGADEAAGAAGRGGAGVCVAGLGPGELYFGGADRGDGRDADF